jgi:hypothetical protein
MNRTRWLFPLGVLLLLGAVPPDALARIKLTTLPVRERVAIQLDHPQIALVEEERIVPLVKGVNQVDFSWANTRIDPDTLVLRILPPPADQPLDARVLSVSYPPDETALVWAVSASASGAARVRISYVLGGLGKDFHYRAVADRDEKNLNLMQFLRVNNNANEAYDDAEFWAGVGGRFGKPLGLDETKEVQLTRFAGVPVRKTYTCDPTEFGYLDRAQDKLNVPMHYVIKNAGGALGKELLPEGKARIFQDDGKGGSAFLGEDHGKFTAPDDELKLYLGLARDIAGAAHRGPQRAPAHRRQSVPPRRDPQVRDRELQGRAGHARHRRKRPPDSQRRSRREWPRPGMATGRRQLARSRPGKERCRQAAVSRRSAGPRHRRSGQKAGSHPAVDPQQRMVSAMNPSKILRMLLLFVALSPLMATARNVDLATVPSRNTVQLTIYNSEDLTLVRETRVVTFKQGVNPLQFSWANTLIDPTSVELKFRQPKAGLEVLDTTFPHDKPQMLYWNVQSDANREATIEISYFTSGISWEADYLAVADPEEKALRLESFVRVRNHSGEDYENAQVRLVVGTINLVEKIAELAKVPVGRVEEDLGKKEYRDLRQQAARKMMAPAAPPAPMMMAGAAHDSAAEVEAPKEIIKEGLSEYFIYTIEGTETVPDGWAKRLRSFEASEVPMTVQYRYRPREYGEQLTRLYLLRNDAASKLGTTPLPDGTLRVFRANGRDGLSYLATQNLKYVPIGDKIELNLGPDPAVVFELLKQKVRRDNLWFQIKGGNLYRKLGEDGVKLELDSQVAGWDEHTVFRQRVRNYTRKPISVQIRRELPGDIAFRSKLNPALHDFQTVQFETEIPTASKAELDYEIVARQGYNQKQNRVELQAGEVGR